MTRLNRDDHRSGFPLAWERLLWSGRPAWWSWRSWREKYHLTDFRAVVWRDDRIASELAIHDLQRVELRESRWQRLRRRSTIVLHRKASAVPSEARSIAPVVFHDIRQGPQLALILELLATDPVGLEIDRSLIEEALASDAPSLFGPRRQTLTAWVAALVLLIFLSGVIVARHQLDPVVYPADDAIYPNGQKRTQAEIVAFMQNEVMPFARRALGPIKGGSEKVTCFTCHGTDAEERHWQMPAVRALPEPDLRRGGMEQFASLVDAQMRNAVYGYLAEDRKQDRAAYMRGVVMPGMARLLHRPAYDFTQTYRYNRSRVAFGCYHCHRVSAVESSGSPARPAFTSISSR